MLTTHQVQQEIETVDLARTFVYARWSEFTDPPRSFWLGDRQITKTAFEWLVQAKKVKRVGPWYRNSIQYQLRNVQEA